MSKRDFELSNILKCKISTVSSLKYSIKKKFSEPMSSEDPSEFVRDLLNLNIKKLTDEGIELLIENRAVKDSFEFWYETSVGTPLTYKRNAKAVPVMTKDFYKMLDYLVERTNKETKDALIKEYRKMLNDEQINSWGDFIIKTIKDAAAANSVWQVGLSVFGNICEFYKKQKK